MAVRLVAGEGKDGGGGFRIGVKSDLNEYRSNCFARTGINAGINSDQNQLFIGSQTVNYPKIMLVKTFWFSPENQMESRLNSH